METAEGGDRTSTAIEIGGARLVATSIEPALRLDVFGATRLFRCAADAPDVSLTVTRAAANDQPRGRQIFDSGALWSLWQCDGEYVFRFTSPRFGAAPYKITHLDSDFRRGRVQIHDANSAYLPAGRAIDPLEYPLDELIVVHWLSRGRGIELHACGIVDEDGGGYLFVGHSGAGKTTVARLWQGPGVVVSDDRIIVRMSEGRAFMYGTPWHGEASLAAPLRAPIKGIFVLKQGDAPALLPLGAATAVSSLLARSFVPYHDAEGLAFTMEFLAALVRGVSCNELMFARDARFVTLVRGL